MCRGLDGGASAAAALGRQLAMFYRVKRFIPRRAQLGLRRALIRWQGTPSFPRWPLDDGVERPRCGSTRRAHVRGAGADELRVPWFWPTPHRAALILSHDVEGDEGIRLALELADLEESLGFRSSFNFGAWYDVDPGVLRELTSRGFEIGDARHRPRPLALLVPRDVRGQLPLLRDLAERLGAVGFRSPATHRVFDWLGELPFEYDGTIPHSDPYEPQPGGCCSLWPFFVGDVVELPYTLPQDHTLLTLLGHRTPTLWIDDRRRHRSRGTGSSTASRIPTRATSATPTSARSTPSSCGDGRADPGLARPAPRVAAWWRGRDAGVRDSPISRGPCRRGEAGSARGRPDRGAGP